MIEKEPLQVKELLDSGVDIVLIDVREKWEFEYCHIPNSIHISAVSYTHLTLPTN